MRPWLIPGQSQHSALLENSTGTRRTWYQVMLMFWTKSQKTWGHMLPLSLYHLQNTLICIILLLVHALKIWEGI